MTIETQHSNISSPSIGSTLIDNQILLALLLEMKATSHDTFQGVMGLLNGFLDKYDTANGIDATGENAYWLAGDKKVTNDGIGGFFTKLYTGNATDDTDIEGLGFQPDMVWIKNRDQTDAHGVFDSVRGATEMILTNATDAQNTVAATLQDFIADGFTIGDHAIVNAIGEAYVAWCFECPTDAVIGGVYQAGFSAGAGTTPTNEKVNANIGMSIIKFNGQADALVLNHSLNGIPQFIIGKAYDDTQNWGIWHQDLADDSTLYFTTAAEVTTSTWDTSEFSTTTIGMTASAGGVVNRTGKLGILYAFTEIAGFSKFGSYIGNSTGTESQSITGLGFRPEMVLIKRIDNAGAEWVIVDDTRGATKVLIPSGTFVESTDATYVASIDDDGFTVGSDATVNQNGSTHIYAAFGAKGDAQDIDLISEAQTADSTPTTATIYALLEDRSADDAETLELNTDIKFWASRVTAAGGIKAVNTVTCDISETADDDYFTFSVMQPFDAGEKDYLCYFEVDGSGGDDPAIEGVTSIKVNVLSTGSDSDMATQVANAINNACDYAVATTDGADVTITCTKSGDVTAAANGSGSGCTGGDWAYSEDTAGVAAIATSNDSYWDVGTITEICNVTEDISLVRAVVDLSGQTSGVDMVYRIVGANTIRQYLHGAVMLWE